MQQSQANKTLAEDLESEDETPKNKVGNATYGGAPGTANSNRSTISKAATQ
jgi:hypothetical protein